MEDFVDHGEDRGWESGGIGFSEWVGSIVGWRGLVEGCVGSAVEGARPFGGAGVSVGVRVD